MHKSPATQAEINLFANNAYSYNATTNKSKMATLGKKNLFDMQTW